MVTKFMRRALPESVLAEVAAETAGIPKNGEEAVRGASAIAAPAQVQKVGAVQVSSPAVPVVNSGPYQVGQVYDVPVNTVLSNPFNPRFIYTATAVDEMTISLQENGQQQSATGYIDEHGNVVLIEGETRLRAKRAAGMPTLRIEIKDKPATDQALYQQARSANSERRDQTPLDDAMRWKELLAKKVYASQKAIAHALKLPEDSVSRTMQLATLSPRFVSAVAEYPQLMNLRMLGALREYVDVKGEDDALGLMLEVVKNGLGTRDVIARRKAAQRDPVKRPRSHKEVVSFKEGSGELKAFEEEGRLELSIKGLTPEGLEELSGHIRKLLGT